MKHATTITTAMALLAWSPATSADAVSQDTRMTPVMSVELTDLDMLAERHLALYRASRASVLSSQERTEDGVPVSVRTSATAAIPLPDQPVSDGSDVPAGR
jgi:hypothetical protein